MRKLASIAGAALMALTGFACPAHAQAPSAGGSCGASYGNYGLTDVNSSMIDKDGHIVPGLFFEVNYSGVPAPTTLGVIVRYNGELETQFLSNSLGTAASSSGTVRRVLFTGGQGIAPVTETPGGPAVDFSTDPAFQGGTGRDPTVQNHNNPGGSGFELGNNRARAGSKDGPLDHSVNGGAGNATGGQSPSFGMFPGEYVFYIYTGSPGDVYNTKDGTVARAGTPGGFIADEKGFLGWFSCGVSTDRGSGPG